ncbi:hypothetical protein CSOJ01_08264 [Colletotrichum sojae]|uniref:Uncharacterized protein n=1 Tax=Colletotrichum sojae TaxID=2175907 RepID=A0A8H6J690_9PEZI|nr:hypothetical protein CSOJ01_08264 [Colletotrichum sojae]
MQVKSILLVAAAATPLLAAPAPEVTDVDGGITADDIVNVWTNLQKIALDDTDASAGVEARSELDARACPYKNHGDCIYQQGLVCVAGCMGAGRRSQVCLARCNATPMNVCHAYGC